MMKKRFPTYKVKYSIRRFLGSKSESTFVFQLQGRLGNQMWGLSDAYLLHKILGKRVLLDLGNCNIDEENSSFYDYVHNLPWLDPAFLEFETSKPQDETKDLELNDFTASNESISFRGFSAHYPSLKKSELFIEKQLPEFIAERTKAYPQRFIALSMRHGDYWQNPHLGILPSSYYKKSIDLIDSLEENLPILLFGDEVNQQLRRIFPKRICSRLLESSKGESPLDDLGRLSQSSYSVIANSTFSFLGAFFSQSKTIFTPRPFYLAVEGWNDNLRNSRTQEVEYSRFPNMRYAKLRIQKKIREF